MHESPDETSRLVVNRVAGRYRGPGRRTAPGSVFVHRCISLPLKTRPPKPRKQTVRQRESTNTEPGADSDRVVVGYSAAVPEGPNVYRPLSSKNSPLQRSGM